MAQKVIKHKSPVYVLDFGLTIETDPTHGIRAVGRLDSADYEGPWFNGLTLSDVTVEDVADDYVNPNTSSEPIVPPGPTIITVLAFKKRFTFGEKVGIVQSTDAGVKVFWDELNTAEVVNLADQETIDGMDYLVSKSLLTSDRKTTILTP